MKVITLRKKLVLEHDNLTLLGLRNLWHSFLPSSLLDLLDKDIVLSWRKVVRLIKLLAMQLYQLWIQRCSIVHTKVSDKITFEELNELREEVNEIKFTLEYRDLVDSKEITSINNLQSLSAAKIKRWLFNYYLVSGDYQKYDEVNNRSKRYL